MYEYLVVWFLVSLGLLALALITIRLARSDAVLGAAALVSVVAGFSLVISLIVLLSYWYNYGYSQPALSAQKIYGHHAVDAYANANLNADGNSDYSLAAISPYAGRTLLWFCSASSQDCYAYYVYGKSGHPLHADRLSPRNHENLYSEFYQCAFQHDINHVCHAFHYDNGLYPHGWFDFFGGKKNNNFSIYTY